MKTALAIATGCTAAALLYSILRIVQAIILPEPDPATVMWTEHSGFFWRAWTCAYAAGAIALIARRFGGDRLGRFMSRAIVPVAAFVLLQAALVP